MVDGRRKHHFVKSSHFLKNLKNHQIIQNLKDLLGPKRAVRFKTTMRDQVAASSLPQTRLQ